LSLQFSHNQNIQMSQPKPSHRFLPLAWGVLFVKVTDLLAASHSPWSLNQWPTTTRQTTTTTTTTTTIAAATTRTTTTMTIAASITTMEGDLETFLGSRAAG